MLRPLLGFLTVALATASVTGCGWYTNIPAQLFASVLMPGSVTYEAVVTNSTREITFVLPKVRIQGQLGSIGADIQAMTIQYTTYNNGSSADLPKLSVGLSVHIQSSNYPTMPEIGVVRGEQGSRVQAGYTDIELPVITRHVTAYGLNPSNNAPLVTAECILSGIDDAAISFTMEPIRIPIYFLGSPGGT